MNHTLKHTLLTTLALAGATVTQAQILTDHFSYSNGDITSVSGGNWVAYSAGTTKLNVTDGAAIINQGDTASNKEDVSTAIGATFSTTGNTKAYVGFDATWTALPTNLNGSYFAVFSTSTSSSTFFGRIGADREGAADGKFRISVANANWSQANTVEFGQDLSLNTTYHVVVAYDLVSKQTTLWVDPTSSGSTSVTATDTVGTQADLTAFSLRQGVSSTTGAPGVIAIDNLAIGTDFNSVSAVPEPSAYAALFAGGLATFALLRRRTESAR
ncbi:MAG TPA: PEP-CTERM sorting domain-containing protein [Candidatus Limnocylindria bacterium]|jgi:hypothetical protein|nr:PEP-CTERM sorting domain-containing protein [Candidatus Limnocylindria bacterium]